MRFSAVAALLPVLATAQQSPLDQARAYVEPYLSKVQSWIPNPNTFDPVGAAAAKAAGVNIDYLSTANWEETLRPAGKSYTAGSEEWWILITGGNKTCFGLCEGIERSFNETAALFKVQPKAPHLASLNCEHSPVLCSVWAAGPPYVWIMEIGAPGTKVPIHKIRLNTTSTTVATFQDLHSTESWKKVDAYEGFFHPFDGQIKQLGLATPAGYILWIFSVIPSWLMMISISFLSRSFMGRGTADRARGPGAAAAQAAARPRGAQPGDAR